MPKSLVLKLAVAVVTVAVAGVQQLTSLELASLVFTGRISGSLRTSRTLAALLSEATTFSPKSNGFPKGTTVAILAFCHSQQGLALYAS